ncbi:MAG: flagellar basal body rod protein FlgB [Pelovirga sp.]|jgi:flagellar basal-body rod protein FlgB
MADMTITDRTFAILEKSLDLRARNQQVIASNLANAETPGYRARKLSFEEDLRRAISRPETPGKPANPRHFPVAGGNLGQVQGRITSEPDNSVIGDGNNVSLDDEMFNLAENQLLYEASSQILKKKLTLLKYAVSDGR